MIYQKKSLRDYFYNEIVYFKIALRKYGSNPHTFSLFAEIFYKILDTQKARLPRFARNDTLSSSSCSTQGSKDSIKEIWVKSPHFSLFAEIFYKILDTQKARLPRFARNDTLSSSSCSTRGSIISADSCLRRSDGALLLRDIEKAVGHSINRFSEALLSFS